MDEMMEFDVRVTQEGHFTVMAYSEKDAYEKVYNMDQDEWKRRARWDDVELEEVY